MDEAAFFKATGDGIFIRAEGHLTAALCPEIKALAIAALESETAAGALFIDLSSCEYMDSTFLGLIVGLNKRLQEVRGLKACLIAPSQTCLGLLKTIGVLKLVSIVDEAPLDFPPSMDRVGKGRDASAGFILDAHEELSALSEDNAKRFSGLTGILRQALEADKKSRS